MPYQASIRIITEQEWKILMLIFLSEKQSAFGYALVKKTGMKPSTVYRILNRWRERGVLRMRRCSIRGEKGKRIRFSIKKEGYLYVSKILKEYKDAKEFEGVNLEEFADIN